MDTKPYIFISYAHKDYKRVIPAIRELQMQGINIWYDNGIEAGSEWPEYVANKVLDCEKFVLFVSNAYMESQNCKQEVQFAIANKKEVLSIYIESVKLSPGMAMQLGTSQAIFCNRFPSMEHCFAALPGERFFNSCKKEAHPKYTTPATGFVSATNIKKSPVYDTVKTPPQVHFSMTGAKTEAVYGSTQTPPQVYYNTKTANTAPAGDSGNPPQFTSVSSGGTSSYPASNAYTKPCKSKAVAIFLAVFLGIFGLHKFYLGQKNAGVCYLLFCWTVVPMIISWGDAITMYAMNRTAFEEKYNCILE